VRAILQRADAVSKVGVLGLNGKHDVLYPGSHI